MPKDSSLRKRVRSEKAKTLSEILPVESKELRKLGLLAAVIFVSTMLSAIFGPEIRALYVSGDILRFFILGLFLFFYTFILLIASAIMIKIFWKKRT